MREKLKPVYFSNAPEDLERLRWVASKGNFSGYIKKLISADMSGGLDPRLKDVVEKFVEAKLQGRSLYQEDGEEVDDDLLKGLF